MVIDKYIEEFNLEPFTFLRKKIYKGTCKFCAQDTLLAFPKLNNVWSFCPECSLGCSLEKITDRKTYTSLKEKLWSHYLKSLELFSIYTIPHNLLSQLGLSSDVEDPFRQHLANGVVAYVPSFAQFTKGLRDYHINVSCRGLSKQKRHEPALLIPRCTSPGMIFGYEVVHSEGIYTLSLPQYTPSEPIKIYLSVHLGAKTLYFNSIEEAFQEMRPIILGDPTKYTVVVRPTNPQQSKS